MEDLSARYNIKLTPSSQEGGNLVQPDLAQSTMTAPGSQPVTPLPAPVQGSDPALNPSGPQVPVSSPRPQPQLGHGDRGNGWTETPDTDDQPKPSPAWKQL